MSDAADRWVQRQLDAAPPLSRELRDQLAELLRPVRTRKAAGERLSSGSRQQQPATSVPPPGDKPEGR
jgi:hypothetical protein